MLIGFVYFPLKLEFNPSPSQVITLVKIEFFKWDQNLEQMVTE